MRLDSSNIFPCLIYIITNGCLFKLTQQSLVQVPDVLSSWSRCTLKIYLGHWHFMGRTFPHLPGPLLILESLNNNVWCLQARCDIHTASIVWRRPEVMDGCNGRQGTCKWHDEWLCVLAWGMYARCFGYHFLPFLSYTLMCISCQLLSVLTARWLLTEY